MSTKIGVAGAAGRMGRMLIEAILQGEFDCTLAAAIENPMSGSSKGDLVGFFSQSETKGVVTTDLDSVTSRIEVLIDFTLPDVTLRNAATCAKHGIAMVIGTTGLNNVQLNELIDLTKSIPVCQAANFSPGMNIAFGLVEKAALALGETVDIEILEAHHRGKVDAPSGTAIKLGKIVAEALGRDFDQIMELKQDLTGGRAQSTVGVSSIRAGDIVGDHTVIFASEGERLEITHKASSRLAFAYGAIRAACWLVTQPAGLYDMRNVMQS